MKTFFLEKKVLYQQQRGREQKQRTIIIIIGWRSNEDIKLFQLIKMNHLLQSRLHFVFFFNLSMILIDKNYRKASFCPNWILCSFKIKYNKKKTFFKHDNTFLSIVHFPNNNKLSFPSVSSKIGIRRRDVCQIGTNIHLQWKSKKSILMTRLNPMEKKWFYHQIYSGDDFFYFSFAFFVAAEMEQWMSFFFILHIIFIFFFWFSFV